MVEHFLQAAAAAIVWVVANVVYVDQRRKGIHGFTRIAAFWAGNPTTWITLFAVEEGTQPTLGDGSGDARDDDTEAELLEEVRRDRARRLGPTEGTTIE